MKKYVLAAAVVALMAAPAAASIVGSSHDLSSSGTHTNKSTDIDRICAFCHTPHKADLGVVNAPLWNRTTVDITASTQLYNSSTLTAIASPGAALVTSINTTDVPLCLSCHDGASMNSALTNAPNVTGTTMPTNMGATSVARLFDGSNALTNDHPVGFNFSTASTQDAGGLNTLTEASAAGVNFYGANNEDMWCSSCHNVHVPGTSTDNTAPFLRTSNAASSLCLACHAK